MEWYWWIAIWLGVGAAIFTVIGIVVVIGDNEGYIPVILLFFFWPLIPFLFVIQFGIEYINDKRKQRQKRRKEAGWWELKEFGGKY